jgi:hypothetical protein
MSQLKSSRLKNLSRPLQKLRALSIGSVLENNLEYDSTPVCVGILIEELPTLHKGEIAIEFRLKNLLMFG